MKKTKIILLWLAFITILNSCKKNESPTVSSVKGNSTLSARDGVWDLLGYGYDATGEYGHSISSKFSIIDVVKLKTDYATRVETDLSARKGGEVVAGENAVSYLSGISNKIGVSMTKSETDTAKIPMFKGSFDKFGENSNLFSSKYVYSSYYLKIQQKRVKINATNALLMQYLTPTFIADVQNSSPAYLVSQYGTHVLKDIILGAKLSIQYRSETTKTDRKDAAQKGIEFNILGIFGFKTSSTSNTQAVSENFSYKLIYETIGGNPAASLSGTVTGATTPTPVPTSAWENSSTVQNSELIDIAPGGLIPIYDLISDPVKSLAVKNYVRAYLLANMPTLVYEPVPVYLHYASSIFDHALSTEPSEYYPGWSNLKISFKAHKTQVPGTVPIYSFYHANWKAHFYAYDMGPSSWSGMAYTGIAFYLPNTNVPGTIPVYEWYRDAIHDWLFDPSPSAKTGQAGWQNKGTAFYAYPAN